MLLFLLVRQISLVPDSAVAGLTDPVFTIPNERRAVVQGDAAIVTVVGRGHRGDSSPATIAIARRRHSLQVTADAVGAFV